MPRMPVPGPIRQSPPTIASGRPSHLVTASLSSTVLSSLSTDLPAHSLGCRSQEGGLASPASPSQSRSQREMTHGYLPPASPWQEGGVNREGEKGRGARLEKGMGMWRPRSGAQGDLPPAMLGAYGCPSLSIQTPSRPGGLEVPALPGVQDQQKCSRDVEGGQGLGKSRGPLHRRSESAPTLPCGQRWNSSGASGPEPKAAWPAGTSQTRHFSDRAPLRPSPGGCPPDPRLLLTAPRWASKTWVPRAVSSQHWRDQLYLGGAGAVLPPQN